MKKHWHFTAAAPAEVNALQAALRIHPLLCELLVQRGIKDYAAAQKFFRPCIETHLYPPLLMSGMEAAVATLDAAIRRKDPILLYGDYDVDGTTSVSLFYVFLQQFDVPTAFYLPNRYTEGYGLSVKGVQYAIEHGFKVLIALDCGTNDRESLQRAKLNGLEIVVCDHHLPDGDAPVSAEVATVLNPKQAHCPYPYKELSACGIAFKLAQAILEHQQQPAEEFLLPLLDILVLSIACDIVEMTDENRTLAYFGLQRLNQTPRVGLQALLKQSGKHPPYSIRDIVFNIGPLINSAGRLGDASNAVRLLIEKDPATARLRSAALAENNQSRRDLQHQVLQTALAAQPEPPPPARAILLANAQWHQGVLGTVAARLTERYYRPVVLLTRNHEGDWVGSARTIASFHLHRALAECRPHLKNFGGHEHAAGLTVAPADLEAFTTAFQTVAADQLAHLPTVAPLEIHARTDFALLLHPPFYNILRQFAPFGPKNMRPVFLSENVCDTGKSRSLQDQHLLLHVAQGDQVMRGIAFGRADQLAAVRAAPFSIVYTLDFQSPVPQFTLKDLEVSG